MTHPIYLHIALRLDGGRKLAFVLRIQSLPRNSRIRSKVARAERMHTLRCVRPALSSLQRMRGPASQCCTHARTYVRASSDARASSSALLTCITAVALQKRTDIFHKVARNMQMEYLLTQLFSLFHIIAVMYSRSFTFEYSDAIGKVTICFPQLNSMRIEGGRVHVKRKEMDNPRKIEWKESLNAS